MGKSSGDFSELLAILKLKRYWNGYCGPFRKNESPDWINIEKNIGIEVVRAISPDDGKMNSIMRKMHGMDAEQCANIYGKTMKTSGYTYLFSDYCGNFLIYGRSEDLGEYTWHRPGTENDKDDITNMEDYYFCSMSYGLVNSDCWERYLLNSVKNKMKKLENYKLSNSFMTCYLFVLFQQITKHSIREIAQQITDIQQDYPVKFEKIILDLGDRLVFIGQGYEIIECPDYKIPRE